MTDNAFKKLEELYLKEKELRDEIAKIKQEITNTEVTISYLNDNNINLVDLRYNWVDNNGKPSSTVYNSFNYPKLLAKALESYKQELGFLLADLKHKAKDVDGLKELISDMEDK